jgi:uncharacterized alkaline shock family protein YloU
MTNVGTEETGRGDRLPAGGEQRQGLGLERRGGASLQTEQGQTSIADSVVAKIAGVATREINGVHDMGTGSSRVFGAIKERLPVGSDQPNPSQGVSVEVGERQAAIDLDVVVDYGVSIVDVSQAIRRNVVQRVEGMTGLEVTEVNIAVDDVWLGESPSEEPRVQ